MSQYVDGTIGRCTWPQAYEIRKKMRDLGADLPQAHVEESATVSGLSDVSPEDARLLGLMPIIGYFEQVCSMLLLSKEVSRRKPPVYQGLCK